MVDFRERRCRTAAAAHDGREREAGAKVEEKKKKNKSANVFFFFLIRTLFLSVSLRSVALSVGPEHDAGEEPRHSHVRFLIHT